MSDESKEEIERRTHEAFERSSWRDPRADYRGMLRRLREQDAVAFESAVAEYEARVAGRLTDPSADPVEAWLEFGERLGAIAAPGRTVRIDADGRADTPGAPAEPALLLHLPDDEGIAAIVIARPRELSRAQQAAITLLSERRQTLAS